MKKLLSILLCITLLNGVSGFPTAAAADLNIDSYYVLPESMTVDSVTIGADGQVTVSDEKTLSVQGDIDSMARWASLTIDNARLNVEGDLRANIPDYATVLQVMDGSTVDIGGSIIRNTNPDAYGYTIEAGSRSSQGMRPSYVRVGQNVQGNIYVYGGSSVDVNGYTQGRVSASGEGTSVTIGDYVKGYIDALNGARVNAQGHAEGGVYARGEGSTVSIGDSLEGQIRAYDQASVDVDGDVVNWAKSMRDDYVAHATAIMANNGAAVTADGNVSAINSDGSLGTGIDAQAWTWNDETPDSSIVEVSGNVQGQIYANGGSTVDVQGHNEGGVYARGEGSTVSIGDSLEGQIRAYDQASVTIGDYVKGYIDALNGSSVDVNGHAEGGVYAQGEGTSVSIGDYVKGYINASGGSSVDVQGHAEGEVYARGEGTSVTIGDYVNGQIRAYNQASVDVQGHVEGSVYAQGDGTHVTIGDGVSQIISTSMPSYAVPSAIDAHNGAKVDVTGDADGLIHASKGGVIDVSGNVKQIEIINPTFTPGISDDIDLSSSVRVGGNVADGVIISMYGDGSDHNKLTVEGTISSQRDAVTLDIQPHIVMDIPYPTSPSKSAYDDDAAYQQAMEQYRQAIKNYTEREIELAQQARNEMNTAEGVQTIIDNLPQIIVGTLAPEADFVLVNDWLNEDNRQQVTEALLSQINYIVNMEGVDTANIAVYGYEELDGYLVAKEQQKLTVKCINDQMVIASASAGRYATIGANTDGSYTITVQRGGDLNLVVTARPRVPAAADNTGRNSAYDEELWGSWLSNLSPDYAKHTLILDLTTILTTDIPYDTLRAYMVNYGIDTMLVITGNAEYTMSLAELIALGEADAAYTFSARDGALELAVNGIVVSTFSVE